ERALVLRVALDHGLVGLDRLLRVVEPRLEDLAEADPERELLLGLALLLGEIDLRAEEVGEVLVAPALLEELREQERRLLVAGVLVEDGAEVLGRLGGGVELVDAEGRRLEAEGDARLGRLGEIEEPRQEREELLVLLALGVEVTERRRRLLIARLVLEDLG